MQLKAKERILKKIRQGLTRSSELPFPHVDQTSPLFVASLDALDVVFAREFTAVNGKFLYCETEEEACRSLQQLARERDWKSLLVWEQPILDLLHSAGVPGLKAGRQQVHQADVGVTGCECLIARTGTIVLSSAGGRAASVFPPVHVVIAYANQTVYDFRDAWQRIATRYDQRLPSMISFATGPSRTADIEKTLVLGAHGPREVYVLFVDQHTT